MQKFSKVPLSSLCQDFVPLLPPKGNSLNFRDLVQSDKQIPTNKIIPTPPKNFQIPTHKKQFFKEENFFEPAWKKQILFKKTSSMYLKNQFFTFEEKVPYTSPKKVLTLVQKNMSLKQKWFVIITGEKQVMLNTNYGEIFLPIL